MTEAAGYGPRMTGNRTHKAVRTLAGVVTLATAVTGTVLTSPVSSQEGQQSPVVLAGPGGKTVWTEGDKAGFGTARTRRSNVWFTLQQGRTSEVFYPDLSTPSVRNLELIVTDGESFADRESRT